MDKRITDNIKAVVTVAIVCAVVWFIVVASGRLNGDTEDLDTPLWQDTNREMSPDATPTLWHRVTEDDMVTSSKWVQESWRRH